MVVRSHRPIQVWLARGLAVGLILALIAGAFWYGRYSGAAGYATLVTQHAETSKHLEEARDESRKLHERIAVLERADQIARDAENRLREDLRDRQEQLAAARAELGFYQGLMNPENAGKGLQVHDVTVNPTTSKGQYRFTLTLTQTSKNAQMKSGQVDLQLDGMGDKASHLEWDAMTADEKRPTYSFKYFQLVRGDIVLPDGFLPRSLKIKLLPSDGHDGFEKDFDWQAVYQTGETFNVGQR